MAKFVLDADGTIKLAKAGVLEELAGSAKCLLTQQVHREIMKGKEKMYEDAFITERLTADAMIRVIKTSDERMENLGAGETSSLSAFRKEFADLIVTDDRKFISALERQNIPFLTPTDVIIWLFKKGKISREKGMDAVERIRDIVRKDAYIQAKKAIGGG